MDSARMEHFIGSDQPEEPDKYTEREFLPLTPDGDIDWEELNSRLLLESLREQLPEPYYDLFATEKERKERERLAALEQRDGSTEPAVPDKPLEGDS